MENNMKGVRIQQILHVIATSKSADNLNKSKCLGQVTHWNPGRVYVHGKNPFIT